MEVVARVVESRDFFTATLDLGGEEFIFAVTYLSDDGEAEPGLEVKVLEVAAEAARHTAAAMSAEKPLDVDENVFETAELLKYVHVMAPSQHVESTLRLPQSAFPQSTSRSIETSPYLMNLAFALACAKLFEARVGPHVLDPAEVCLRM